MKLFFLFPTNGLDIALTDGTSDILNNINPLSYFNQPFRYGPILPIKCWNICFIFINRLWRQLVVI